MYHFRCLLTYVINTQNNQQHTRRCNTILPLVALVALALYSGLKVDVFVNWFQFYKIGGKKTTFGMLKVFTLAGAQV